MRRIETFEQLREVLERPLPAIECRPFLRQPDVAVLCRAYTLGGAIGWRKSPPYAGYGPDRKALVGRPERWEETLLLRTAVWPEAVMVPPLANPDDLSRAEAVDAGAARAIPHPLAGQGVFTGQKGRALWWAISQNSPGVIQTLTNHCHAASGLYFDPQVEGGLETRGGDPAEGEPEIELSGDMLLEALLGAYQAPALRWCWNLFPQDREAALRVGTYSLADLADSQMAAATRLGYEAVNGFPNLLWPSLRDADGGPLVPDDTEVRAWVIDHLPFGVAQNLVGLAGRFSEVGELPLDFFGGPPTAAPSLDE